MAESAVTFLLHRLTTLPEQELKLLTGVPQEVEFITKELQMIQGFLRDADAREECDKAVKAWVDQVRDIAYDMEEILDEFTFRLEQQYQRHGFVGFLHKTVNFVNHLKLRHNLATKIQAIKTSVVEVAARRQRYGLNCLEQSSSSNSKHNMLHNLRQNALLLEEAELVGINEPKTKLVMWLVEGESRLEVVSVWSMGGSGKTTLVRKVYEHPRVKEYFEHHAWINVSESFKPSELLKDLIKQLYHEIQQLVPQGVDNMGEVALKMMVREFLLQKRYVIVLDDIWSIDAWEGLKYALPDSNCYSRIMVTTRSSDIASFCKESYGHIYNLEPLAEEDSWTLFCNKVFRGNICPPQLEGLSRNILKRCGGLPLAIVTIGGVLSTKNNNLIEWEMVHRSLGSLLESNDKLKNMQKILSLSYNDLPYHLKPCFLYLSIFPEDYMMKSSKLIKIWIAEGLVIEKERMTHEEVAESYLHELANRSLLQITRVDRFGQLKSYKIHDLVRDIIVKKSREQNFGAIATEHNTELNEKVRRLSIHNSVGNVYVPQNKNFAHLRSLFMFGVDTLPKSYMSAFFSSFRLLRVLDLSDVPLEKLPQEIVNLFNLRYLSLRRTKIKELPNSIGKLQNLETLDLRDTKFLCKLPNELFKLKQLRCLKFVNIKAGPISINESPKQVGIWSLVNLQVLCDINVDQGGGVTRELGRLTKLRRLRIRGLKREDGVNLCCSIEKMSNLRFLAVISEKVEVLDIQSLSLPPMLLQKLHLEGRLEKFPNWIPSLNNLEMIFLMESRLRDDPLEVLQALPNLVDLTLDRAYDGEEMCFKERGFQSLKNFSIRELRRLRLVRVEEGALPHLEDLFIYNCKMLQKVPLGIECLTNLKIFMYCLMSDEFMISLNPGEQGEQGVDYWKVAHIPIICRLKISYDKGSISAKFELT
ncbi:hypothetical protein HHK36_020215 [Tetracentron sinense]|uniref:Uncharacterized protein n=1 Tax=Tetracentron sinense TaxID=13715 RepID=A0A834YX11_TETSI|nr:hypothetical protein HHK36_020215 [Tetracentron sinense]